MKVCQRIVSVGIPSEATKPCWEIYNAKTEKESDNSMTENGNITTLHCRITKIIKPHQLNTNPDEELVLIAKRKYIIEVEDANIPAQGLKRRWYLWVHRKEDLFNTITSSTCPYSVGDIVTLFVKESANVTFSRDKNRT